MYNYDTVANGENSKTESKQTCFVTVRFETLSHFDGISTILFGHTAAKEKVILEGVYMDTE